MDIKIHCPGCQAQLRVPRGTSGRRARCPKCARKFLIPNPSELFEETVSTWIESDVEDARRFDSGSDAHEAPLDKTIMGQAIVGGESSIGGHSTTALDDPLPQPTAQRPTSQPTPPPEQHRPTPTPAPAATGSHAPGAGESQLASGDIPKPIAPDRPLRRAPTPAGPRPDKIYPTELRPGWDRPYLVVLQCDQNGVRFAFDSVWLDDEGFRASFPMQCMFSGVTGDQPLLARPLAFVDQTGGSGLTASQVERGHEHHLNPESPQSPRALIHAMGELPALPRPFNRPMPYYVTHDMSNHSLKCATHTREGGGVTCEVIIPHAPTALEWLGRVNGVCGVEYELLSHDIHEVGGDAWRTMPEKCRQRLSVWCQFDPTERFRLYLNDADFTSADIGLAGLVVTDRRILFHKYHHSGEINLTDDAVLRIRLDDAEFATLTLEQDRHRTRVAKLHRHDLAKLSDALRNSPGLRLETANIAQEAPS